MTRTTLEAACACEDLVRTRAVGRRGFLQGLAVTGGAAALASVGVSYATAAPGAPTDTLVVLFARGGQDGLSIVAPVADASYQNLRPNIRIQPSSALQLDPTFAMSQELRPLLDVFKAGQLGFVHAAGIPNGTRSHFDAQNSMETATGSGGWLDRFMGAQSGGSALAAGAFRGVQRGGSTSLALAGPVPTLALTSLASFRLNVWSNIQQDFRAGLASLYGAVGDDQDVAAGTALAAITAAEPFQGNAYAPENGASYGDDEVAVALRDVAQLIKADVGAQVVCVDIGGWDMHEDLMGQMPSQLRALGAALAAFNTDMGSRMSSTTVVSMTEFGRRAQENGSGGLDHGSGSLMMLMGGGVRGGKVHGAWPGLGPAQLNAGGDLAVTTDYRDVLAEILSDRMGASAATLSTVFPGWSRSSSLDVVRAR